MKNRKCKKCGNKFHACTNCGLLHEWEYEYCSDYCWEFSEELLIYKSRTEELYKDWESLLNSLDNEGKEKLEKFIRKVNVIIMEPYCETYMNDENFLVRRFFNGLEKEVE